MASMTRLSLLTRLRSECVGVSGAAPTTTLAQTGDMLNLVNWIDSAYEDIQNMRRDWNFLRDDFTFQTVAAQQTYTPTQAGAVNATPAEDLGEWITDSMRCYLTATGVSAEIDLDYVPWDDFRETYMKGSIRATTGQPHVVTVKPNHSLMLWPIPDAVYTVVGEYYQTPSAMTADASVPILPSRFHMLIVWRALVFYAGHAAAPETFAVGKAEYDKMLSQLMRAEAPRPSL